MFDPAPVEELPLVEPGELRGPRPIVKWVGGKTRLLPRLLPLLPQGCDSMRHVEPFFGGGALFFARRPTAALLADNNPDLCAMYAAVRCELESVVAALRDLAVAHNTEHFYAVRAAFNHPSQFDAALRAAMFLYLNKTCFNGLHRVNQRGEFNVPAGRYQNPGILDLEALSLASCALSGAAFRCASFEATLQECRHGDFVYLDPPYAPASPTANFTQYSREGFGSREQQALAAWFATLDRRGCCLMLSNSDVPAVRALYRRWRIDVVDAPRTISCNPRRRSRARELIVRNY